MYQTSSQDGSIGRYTLPPGTTKRRTTTNLKTKNYQNCQKIELYGSLTTKELKKKHSPRLVGGVKIGSWGKEGSWQTGRNNWGVRQTTQPRVPAWGNKASKPLTIKTCVWGVTPGSQESVLERPTGSLNVHKPTQLGISTRRPQFDCV